jgi:hypothetical protein
MPRFLAAFAILAALSSAAFAEAPPVAELQKQADESAAARDAAQAKFSEVETQLRALEQTLLKLKSDVEQTQKSVTDTDANLKKQQEEVTKTAAAKTEADKAAEVSNAAVAEAQKKAEEAKKVATVATEAADKAAAEVKKSQDSLAALQQMMTTLQTGLTQSTEQLATVTTSFNAAKDVATAARADWLGKAKAVEGSLRESGQWVSFAGEVAPIFQKRCLACHNARASKGRLNLESYAALSKGGESGPAFVAGDVANSNLHSQIAEGAMPKDAAPLTAEQAALIDKWIALGAKLDAGADPNAPLFKVMPKFAQPAAPEAYTSSLPITAIAFSPDGQLLATGGYHELLLWNPADHSLVRRIGNVAERVFDISFSPDGTKVAIAAGTPGQTGELKVFQVSDGAPLADLVTVDDAMFGIAFSPDGTRLAGCGADRSLNVFEVATWQQQLRLEDHADWVLDVNWSPDATKLVTASRDKTSKIFDARTGDAIATFNGHGDVVYSAAFLADNAQVVSAGRDKRLRVFKAADAQQVREIGGFGGDVLEAQILADGRVFTAGGDNHARLHNSADGAQIRDFAGHKDWVYCIDANLATGRLATGSYDGEVRLWNIEDAKPLADWIASPGYQPPQAAAK